jgi:hypothetical protein
MRLMSAGETVAVDTELPWAGRMLERAVGTGPEPGSAMGAGEPTVRISIEAATAPFAKAGLRPVTRGAYSDGRRTVLTDAGGSGFDLQVIADEQLGVIARYRPSPAVRAANRALRHRFGLLAGQVLVHYPVLWRASWRGRVPLHASVLSTAEGTPLIAGPGGVGKSTVLVRALAAGATATADNICCADDSSCHGLAEPVRTDAIGVQGARTSHGRVELPLAHRVARLRPDRVVVLERGPHTEIEPADSAYAARALTAGTYAAGELRRYWAFAATLALATGRGPAHPPISEVASSYAARLPCLRVRVGDGASVSIADMCAEVAV